MNERTASPMDLEISRRRFLQGSSLVGFSAFLVACGTQGTGSSPSAAAGSPSSSAAASASASPSASAIPQSPSAELNFANWPLYIDTDEDDETKH